MFGLTLGLKKSARQKDVVEGPVFYLISAMVQRQIGFI